MQNALADVVLLQTDVTANDALDQVLLAQFGIFGPDGHEQRELRVIG